MNVHHNKWNLLHNATSVLLAWDFQGMDSVCGGN